MSVSWEGEGARYIGRGNYSTVYRYNAHLVLKVSRGDDWPDYVVWATANRYAGGFAPLVYGIKRTRAIRGTFGGSVNGYVALMEKLSHRPKDLNATCARYDGEFQGYIDRVRDTFRFLDLNGGINILYRGNTPVLVDPITRSHCSGRYFTEKRWRLPTDYQPRGVWLRPDAAPEEKLN